MTDSTAALWPFGVYFLGVLLLVATMLGLSWVLGQRRANAATNMPFESGVLSVGSPQLQLSVEFYLVAILFVIFDLETVFILAWAVAFFELGWSGFAAVLVFIVILVAALIYELSTGALDWGNKKRAPARSEELAEPPLTATATGDAH
ncbi:MAG: NADH-quinone oxidoreductase subunit A [Pseudomonadota bacterium]